MITFEPFPKIVRLSRECIITEKLDGTNAQVIVDEDGTVAAASRTRLITPEDDNYGFAKWVRDHADELRLLGPGRHFGEWWGQKIQRGYGLTEKRFSLFNTTRWCSWHEEDRNGCDLGYDMLDSQEIVSRCCHVVPEIYRGPFTTDAVSVALATLERDGSIAAPGFTNPEGIVIFHTAGNYLFKKTLDNDAAPKGRAA